MMRGSGFALALVVSLVAATLPSRLEAQRLGQPGVPGEPRREALERRIRERIALMVRDRLRLNDEQMRQLQETNQRFERRRRELNARERAIRIELRDELVARDSANQTRVGELLDTMLRIQRDRFAIVEAEQQELRRFLTPVQRAHYLALQDQMRRRIEDLRRERQLNEPGARPRPPGARRPPPPRARPLR